MLMPAVKIGVLKQNNLCYLLFFCRGDFVINIATLLCRPAVVGGSDLFDAISGG